MIRGVFSQMPTHVDWHERNGDRQGPQGGDERAHLLCSHPLVVSEGIAHVAQPVEGDDAEVEDGRRAAGDVQADPQLASHRAEPPLLRVVDEGEGHDSRGHQQVGDRQRHDEQVGPPASQAPIHDDRNDHQQVSQNGDDDRQGQENL